ncbi:unnamed protein product [Adineta steineri]|uniref:Apple domain-containing protein n=1 Tax=Adineta steineri TaxID=433720 RepID=A0A818KCX3_9BILA|nr:unnamed protein product [Adineta steineri]CAF0915730.1 unnamed protein product [Adineta steineri]CAF1345550.1 unnamed protein product [Adineta steineri]CAF3555396.1 unnamed protein product [Adineta steineri]CAF3763621.1 unnamed protein product [Adineta steineri]
MSTKAGWQFQCSNSSCSPLAVVIVSNIRQCQMACLAEIHCKAVSFYKSSSNCELFADISNQNGNLVSNMDTVTMTVMDGTRLPPEPTTTSTTTSSSTSSSTSSTSSTTSTTTTTTSSATSSTSTTSTTSTTSSTTSTTTTTTTTSSSTSSTTSTTSITTTTAGQLYAR